MCSQPKGGQPVLANKGRISPLGGGPSARLRGSQDRLWAEGRLVLRAMGPGKLGQEAGLNLGPEGRGGFGETAEQAAFQTKMQPMCW